MHPRVAAFFLFAACSGPTAFHPALPELLVAQPITRPLHAPELLLVPGEHLVWEVHLHGMTIGRAELEVSDGDVRSRFQTDSLAGALVSVHHDLFTLLDRPHARARAGNEVFEVKGETKKYDATFDGPSVMVEGQLLAVPGGSIGQTAHTALGLLRAWCTPDASPGYLVVLEQGELWRLDVGRPTVDELQGVRAFRIDGRIRAKQPIAFVMWLSDSEDRKPLRIEISDEDFHVTAELVPA